MLAVDFETLYTKEYSLTIMSTWSYVYDERFDAYKVSAWNDDVQWVGHPKDFDWNLIKGQTLLAHNVSFDGLVLRRLRELGIVPADCVEAGWLCTADMAAYLRTARSLQMAVKNLLGRERDKSTRAKMLDKTAAEIVDAGDMAEVDKYALLDARDCWDLFQECGKDWPENERVYSNMLREACWRGMPVNAEKAKKAAAELKLKLFEIERSIPWTEDGRKPLSPKALREQARIEGIPVPASLSKVDPAAIQWFEDYGEKYPWVLAVRDYRSLNSHLAKVAAVADGVRPDGTFPLQIKYGGAHTMRTSAGSADTTGGKFNPLNMPRKALFGVDLRELFEAPPGYTFIICDYAQIEALILLWRVGDTAFLERVRSEGNVYQAYAKQVGWYSGNNLKADNPGLYQQAKVSVLQLGYQSGAAKLMLVAQNVYGMDMNAAQAEALVTAYRAANPRIVQHWYKHQIAAAFSAHHNDPTHEVVLASGRVLTYYKPHVAKNIFGRAEVRAWPIRGLQPSKLYGGLLCENEIQATARDVLRDGRIAAEHAGHKIVLDVYDELVELCPESEASDRAKDLRRLMITSSPWLGDCPLDAEYKISPVYLK